MIDTVPVRLLVGLVTFFESVLAMLVIDLDISMNCLTHLHINAKHTKGVPRGDSSIYIYMDMFFLFGGRVDLLSRQNYPKPELQH